LVAGTFAALPDGEGSHKQGAVTAKYRTELNKTRIGFLARFLRSLIWNLRERTGNLPTSQWICAVPVLADMAYASLATAAHIMNIVPQHGWFHNLNEGRSGSWIIDLTHGAIRVFIRLRLSTAIQCFNTRLHADGKVDTPMPV
jgi:hypothetical protein